MVRLFFGSGVMKFASGDPAWRDMSALASHYETQPIPTRFAWHIHAMPSFMHALGTVLALAIEIVCPWGIILCSRRGRHWATTCLVALQFGIGLSGQFCYFNLLSAGLCAAFIDDEAWAIMGFRSQEVSMKNPTKMGGSVQFLVCIIVATLNVIPFLGMIYPSYGDLLPGAIVTLMHYADLFRVVNSYGLFSAVVTTRANVVIEASSDLHNWREHALSSYPGPLARSPELPMPWSPLNRLDLMMWFAPLGQIKQHQWLAPMLRGLLEGDGTGHGVLPASLSHETTGQERWCAVRAVLYHYRFDTSGSGAWWCREWSRPLLVMVRKTEPGGAGECSSSRVQQLRRSWCRQGILAQRPGESCA